MRECRTGALQCGNTQCQELSAAAVGSPSGRQEEAAPADVSPLEKE